MERLVSVLRQTGDPRDEPIADGIDALRKIRGKDIPIASYLGLEQLPQPFVEKRSGRRIMSLYEQTAVSIREKILLGQYPYRSALPTENKLLEEYSGISRGTLREALRMLREEGLIESMQGRGNYVLHQQRRVTPCPSEHNEA